jgi:hypothetical protein
MPKGEVMKKQLLKGFSMLLLVITLALVTAVVSANGQSLRLKADVPFEFVVGSETLTAGQYTVEALASSRALRVRNGSDNQSAIRLTTPADDGANKVALVFHRYGARYFLAEVWNGAEGLTINKSKQEQAIERELARIAHVRHEIAKAQYELVEIAATH